MEPKMSEANRAVKAFPRLPGSKQAQAPLYLLSCAAMLHSADGFYCAIVGHLTAGKDIGGRATTKPGCNTPNQSPGLSSRRVTVSATSLASL